MLIDKISNNFLYIFSDVYILPCFLSEFIQPEFIQQQNIIIEIANNIGFRCSPVTTT